MAAFVLGNGVSRRPIDVKHLTTLGPVYGCNALYRTDTPTVLVATDVPISQIIQESGYSAKHRFYTRKPIPGLGAFQIQKKYYGFSSGPIAMSIAAEDFNNPIYLLGFDMGPSEAGKFNNLYANTEFYKKSDGYPTFTGNWAKQMASIIREYKNVTFYRVQGATTSPIREFDNLPNLTHLPFTDFVTRINNPKDL
jgi:hypothetical protein